MAGEDRQALEMAEEPQCFYSNCLIEAVRAKCRNRAVRWIWMPLRYNPSLWPHVLWQEGNCVVHFRCMSGTLPWWKRFWFKGYLKRYSRAAFDRIMEKKQKRYG